MSRFHYLLVLLVLLTIPSLAHASAGEAATARDWAPCLMAGAALCLRIRFFGRRRSHR